MMIMIGQKKLMWNFHEFWFLTMEFPQFCRISGILQNLVFPGISKGKVTDLKMLGFFLEKYIYIFNYSPCLSFLEQSNKTWCILLAIPEKIKLGGWAYTFLKSSQLPQLFNSFELGNGSKMSDKKLAILEIKACVRYFLKIHYTSALVT